MTPEVSIRIPDWLDAHLRTLDAVHPEGDERMRLVIELSRLNVRHGTGGPFGAAVFARDSGRLLAAGVNCVETSGRSVAHAEVVAILAAQARLGTYDLGGPGRPEYELVSSAEPCAMCLGAVCWSGVRRLVCGARDEDVRRIGFDEGPKPADWTAAFEARGIRVVRDVLRDEAVSVLRLYQAAGGVVYNARQGSGR
ncbi:MAG: nucleoside deaminase [Candidatus Brocadiaceae bacterium]|nr:nucleoside deaminase [Candidatus Brocadiaceae bacterium]